MEVTVHGKQMDVGEALRTHVQDKLTDISQKYFNHTTFATVTFSKEGHGHPDIRAHISLQAGRNIMVVADALKPDAYAAFDNAADKAAKQLRRYKRKLRDHHERQIQMPETEIMKARDYVLASTPDLEADKPESAQDQDEPMIIAEMATQIETMTVSDAVMRMDLSGQTAFLFRNATHEGLNVVYKRPDGHVGWIDPENDVKKIKKARSG